MTDLSDHIAIVQQSVAASVRAWSPELVLLATLIILLLQRMVWPAWKRAAHVTMFLGSLLAAGLCFWQSNPGSMGHGIEAGAFLNILQLDQFGHFLRIFLLVFIVLFTVLTWLSGWPKRDDLAEFYLLILGAVIGMSVMVTARNMLVVFLGMEMASLPSYVLAGFEKQHRRAGEAAMKFAVFGAAMAGVMLYGLSLLGGILGSLDLPTMGKNLALLASEGFRGHGAALALGTLMVLAGIGFKLSAVPFHFWLPDVFEGASAQVGAFLSVVSKAAALGLLTRIVFGLLDASESALTGPMGPLVPFVVGTLSLLAAITCTYGNLAAYGQRNFKRLLGYSTIAHAGYLMMPLAAAVAFLPRHVELARLAVAAMLFYLVVYLFMNLVAFTAAAFLQSKLTSEQIEDYAGLVRVAPGFVICLAIALFSLVGLPPLGGFAGKFAIFASLVSAQLWALFVVAAFNTALSLFYYVRIIKVMVLDSPPQDKPFSFPVTSGEGLFLTLLTIPIVGLGIFWQPVLEFAFIAAGCL